MFFKWCNQVKKKGKIVNSVGGTPSSCVFQSTHQLKDTGTFCILCEFVAQVFICFQCIISIVYIFVACDFFIKLLCHFECTKYQVAQGLCFI